MHVRLTDAESSKREFSEGEAMLGRPQFLKVDLGNCQVVFLGIQILCADHRKLADDE